MAVKSILYQTGDVVPYAPGATACTAGKIVSLDGIAGQVISDIAASGTGNVRIRGVIEVNCAQGGTFTRGCNAMWDNTGTDQGTVTGGAATDSMSNGDFHLGRFLTSKAGNAHATALVDLNTFAEVTIGDCSGGTMETVGTFLPSQHGGTTASNLDSNFQTLLTLLQTVGIVKQA